jgi:hypothetical protein
MQTEAPESGEYCLQLCSSILSWEPHALKLGAAREPFAARAKEIRHLPLPIFLRMDLKYFLFVKNIRKYLRDSIFTSTRHPAN